MTKKPLVSFNTAKILLQKHASPLYVYRKSIVLKQYRNLVRSIRFPNTTLYYACKANANRDVLKSLKEAGASIECVSRGEILRAISVGFPRKRISYTCSNITYQELAWVMKRVGSVHLDSLLQLTWWGMMNPGGNASLRVNRGFGAGATSHIITGGPESKFGIYYTDLAKAEKIAKRFNLKIVGLEQHIGSSILKPDAFIRAMGLLLESAKGFPNLQFLDFGGGFGIPYRPEEGPLDIKTLGKNMGRLFDDFCKTYGRNLELRIEPGRYIIAEAGAFLVTVVDRKNTPGHAFVGVDSGFSHLIRPAFYGSYHHIFNLSNTNGKKERVTIVGNLCESSDVFAKNRNIPKIRVGDILLFADSGAYGYSMASDYNLRPKPKEIIVP